MDSKKKEKGQWGHISEQGSEFRHYVSQNAKMILLGVDKYISHRCDTSLLACVPVERYCSEEFWEIYTNLTYENQKIMQSTLDKLKGEMRIHIGCNWRVVSSFICQCNKIGLMQDAASFAVCLNQKSDDPKKQCYDRMNKARGQWKLSEETRALLRCVCAYYFISPEILDTGEGYFYCPKQVFSEEALQELDKKYSPKAIHEKLMNDPALSLIELITQLTGLDRSELDEYKVRIASKTFVFEAKTHQALLVFAKSLLESQV